MSGSDAIPGFSPENPLEAALAEAAANPSQRPAFLEKLYDSEVLIPAPGPAPAEDRLMSAPPGSEIDLPVIQDEGRQIVPAFSSMVQLLRFVPEGSGYIQVAVRDLVKLWRDDLWLGLNPRGPGVLLGPADVRRLGGEVVPAPRREGEYVLGEPTEEPDALLDAVRAYAERSGTIAAAYRALMVDKEEGARPRIVIGLDLVHGADRDTVFAQVVEAARGTGIEGVALVPVALHGPGTVARYLVQNTTAFYRRDP